MDETDVALCRLLMYNSRMPYSELAKILDTSVQSVHRRVQDLVAAGIIAGFKANFSQLAYRGVWVMVRGRSEAPSVNKVLEDLKKEQAMDMAMVAGGKYLYLNGMILDPSKLNRFVSSVTRIAQIPEPEVGVVDFPLPVKGEEEPVIYPMDIKIVNALRNDARRPVTDLAKELGVAPRTVTRHLDRLNREMLVHFSIELYAYHTSDLFANLYLRVKRGVEREKVAMSLIKRLALRELITYNFGDRPDQLITMFWAPNIKEINDIVVELEGSGMFETVEPNLVLDVRYYEGYKDVSPPLRSRIDLA